jgi:subtilisin family serine protease
MLELPSAPVPARLIAAALSIAFVAAGIVASLSATPVAPVRAAVALTAAEGGPKPSAAPARAKKTKRGRSAKHVAMAKQAKRADTTHAVASPPSVIVAVIDGGVDITHPDLRDHLWQNKAEVPGNGVDDDGNGIVDDVNGASFTTHTGDVHDDTGHGTHVSGIILQTDPSAKIMALKAGNGHFVDVPAATAAIYYAVDHGARVINLSWAFPSGDGTLAQALQYAHDHGVLVAAAAGNFGHSNDVIPTFPASYSSDTLVAVAATCDGQTLASFSNYGKLSVTIAAPGCDIRSTVPGGGYALMTGTSMAAPEVAGAAALLLERDPSAHATDIEHALLGGAQPQPGFADSVSTGATLNVGGALVALAAPDRTAPSAFRLGSPAASFATTRDPSYYYQDVTFSWSPSSDSALAGYKVVVDGAAVAATSLGQTSVTAKIPPGSHTWQVVAFDRSGNQTVAAG